MSSVHEYIRDMFASGLELSLQTLKSGARADYRDQVETALLLMIEEGDITTVKKNRFKATERLKP